MPRERAAFCCAPGMGAVRSSTSATAGAWKPDLICDDLLAAARAIVAALPRVRK